MFRIKKLHIFILKQFCLLFIATFFICQFVLMMQFLWQHIDDLIGKGLTMDVLAQFFWYMGLMLVPQALPLAILLSSLITFGNLGESSELTAIKAAGISLMQAFRGLIAFTVLITCVSFLFQNNIGPKANQKIAQLIMSMKQKSPELEIPEGVFYDGIPNCNLYVQKKNMDTGKLYGIMIYRMTGGYEDQAIILADSGMLQSTEDKQHLVLSLWSGEWFENMRSQEIAGNASVPFRRETFAAKKIIFEFDGGFNMTDGSLLANNARGKSLEKIKNDMDSLSQVYDSIGTEYDKDLKTLFFKIGTLDKKNLQEVSRLKEKGGFDYDSIKQKLTEDERRNTINAALQSIKREVADLEFKSIITATGDFYIRQHKIEIINKFLLALSCILFFFIGAPLGAIIRKGGLGFPVLISVVVYISYYILDNVGYRMARQGSWAIWFGKSLSTAVLAPLATWVTYKANNDSVVFNKDLYMNFIRRLLGLRLTRGTYGKEVIIEDPHYLQDVELLTEISEKITAYDAHHNLKKAPNPKKVFFEYREDNEIQQISEQLEGVVDDLANSRDRIILGQLSAYPVVSEKAHTRPFERKWLNMAAAIVIPVGIILYIRMWMFRLRLEKDLHTIRENNQIIINQIQAKHLKA